MLAKNQVQERPLIVMTQTQNNTYQQLENLLAAQPQLQNCLKLSQDLFETHFAQETKTKVGTMTWLELQAQLFDLEETLLCSVKHAQDLLDHSTSVSAFELSTSQLLNNWLMQSKRNDLLELFRKYKINEELSELIDEAFSENATAIVAFLKPSVGVDLLALLEEQVKDFSTLAKKFGLALTSQEQEDALYKLLGDPSHSEELMFDVFASGLMAMSDLELTLATISTYMVLYA